MLEISWLIWYKNLELLGSKDITSQLSKFREAEGFSPLAALEFYQFQYAGQYQQGEDDW